MHWHCSRLPAVVVAAAVAACPGCTGPPVESPVAVVSAASRDLTLAAVVDAWEVKEYSPLAVVSAASRALTLAAVVDPWELKVDSPTSLVPSASRALTLAAVVEHWEVKEESPVAVAVGEGQIANAAVASSLQPSYPSVPMVGSPVAGSLLLGSRPGESDSKELESPRRSSQ